MTSLLQAERKIPKVQFEPYNADSIVKGRIRSKGGTVQNN
jgi:hypothetical protein